MMRALPPPARRLGPAVIVGLAAAWAVRGSPLSRLASLPPRIWASSSAESVLLLSTALVPISTPPWVEGVFDGIDRAAIWAPAGGHYRDGPAGPGHPAVSEPTRSRLGPLLAVIGAAGLLILAVWAILPRWRSLIPRALHRPVLAVAACRVCVIWEKDGRV